MRLPKRLVPVPLQPIFRRLRDIARKAAGHQILLVRMPSSELGMHVIQGCRSSQIYPAIGARVIPVVKD
jgi:hypothetical protein